MKLFPNSFFQRNNKGHRQKMEEEFLRRQVSAYYTKVHELTDEQLQQGLEILRISNDDDCLKW